MIYASVALKWVLNEVGSDAAAQLQGDEMSAPHYGWSGPPTPSGNFSAGTISQWWKRVSVGVN